MGIVVASGFTLAPLLIWVVAGGLLALSGVVLLLRQDRLAMLLLFASFVGLGALRGGAPFLPLDHISRLTLPPTVSIEGRIVDEPARADPERTRLLLEVEAYYDALDRRPAEGRVQLTIYGEAPSLGEGQRVRAEVRLHRPIGLRNPGVFDYPAHLRREGIFLVGNGRGDRVTPLTPDTPSWPIRVRRWAVATISGQLPESSAALLAGLLLGERTALPPQTDEAFRRAGVYHVLAVSGFNVALLASSVFGSLGLLGVPRRPTALAAAAVLVGFALIVGGQPSILRATVMGLLVLLSVLLERESQVMNALSLSALLLLVWRPSDLWDPGFQLSFAATAGIIYLAATFTSFLNERKVPRWLAAAIAVSLAAQLPVTPVMLGHFNQLSIIGVAANLLVVPLAGPATMLGMLALLLHLANELAASLVFNTLWLLLTALRVVVWVAASIPGAMVHLPAPSWAAVAAWCGALLLIPFMAARVRIRFVVAALLTVTTALSLWPWVRPGEGRLRITFLDVGQGDATFVELPEGPRLLVDAGPGGPRRFDVGERVLSPFLWNRPVARLDVVALSHADSDHSGGLAAVFRHFRVGEFWESGRWNARGKDVLPAVLQSGAPRRLLSAGQRMWIGNALITVLNPDTVPNVSANDDSLVLRLDWRGVSTLIAGDLGGLGETRMLDRGEPVRVLVLRVAHHGSRFSSTTPFLDAAHPSVAIISVGARNPFRHPTTEALTRLEASGARIYRTDRDGAIVVETDGARLWITRWAGHTTDVFDLDPEPRAAPGDESTTAPGIPEAGVGRAESGREDEAQIERS